MCVPSCSGIASQLRRNKRSESGDSVVTVADGVVAVGLQLASRMLPAIPNTMDMRIGVGLPRPPFDTLRTNGRCYQLPPWLLPASDARIERHNAAALARCRRLRCS